MYKTQRIKIHPGLSCRVSTRVWCSDICGINHVGLPLDNSEVALLTYVWVRMGYP